MNGPIVLDTNAIISLFDGNRYIADMLGEEKSVIVPSIVCGEFEDGHVLMAKDICRII